MKIYIREETIDDYDIVYNLIDEAFKTAVHADGNEASLVQSLRLNKDYFIKELSLVAIVDNSIVGHILFTKVHIGDNVALALAPVSVKLEYRHKGVARALIQAGHNTAKDLGYEYIVVLGDPKFYSKFMYKPSQDFNIEPLYGIPSEYYLVLKLKDDAQKIKGRVKYAPEFSLD